ncbi:SDR family NAD(P)-dependent oxidoreductase [Halanaerobium kushneri]|uniref:Short-chain dehydrogenase n=1 Tax=Halanaerobium kushneri TaxID=56779 RepID=A0A1N6PKY2_9FIRM|nr:SDR family NAD(P)-dependent oxidoreductase [Halanaerobium kushneri]SIQ04872.1 Short-chain dehydrogenase [Halanaerobium kushneri]
MKKAIIIGASSGIGKELAEILSENNYILGLVSRREKLLVEIQKKLPKKSFVKSFDITSANSRDYLEELIQEMNGVDLIIISAGRIFINHQLEFEKEKKTIELNVLAFTKMINTAYKYFSQKGEGQIVGISSVAALRGGYDAPAYHASKAFVSNYMEGLRIKAKKSKLPITITDIKPGYVNTRILVKENLFWVAEPEKAALQIYQAIDKKKDHAYITKRWTLIAWLLKIVPDFIYKRF